MTEEFGESDADLSVAALEGDFESLGFEGDALDFPGQVEGEFDVMDGVEFLDDFDRGSGAQIRCKGITLHAAQHGIGIKGMGNVTLFLFLLEKRNASLGGQGGMQGQIVVNQCTNSLQDKIFENDVAIECVKDEDRMCKVEHLPIQKSCIESGIFEFVRGMLMRAEMPVIAVEIGLMNRPQKIFRS